MFKGFQSNKQFNGFPDLNFQHFKSAYGFSGLSVWLDAARGLNTQTDAANISSWVEQVRGIIFAQGTAASQPIWRASDANFNNLPSVDFNTAQKLLNTAQGNNGTIDFSHDSTLFFVYKANSINALNYLLTNGQDSVNVGVAVVLGGTNSASFTGIGWQNGNGIAANIQFQSTIEDVTPHIVVMTHERIIVDGVEVATGSFGPAAGYQSWNTFGLSAGTTGRNVLARIAELGVFKQLLSSEDCITLSDRLNVKYAIY